LYLTSNGSTAITIEFIGEMAFQHISSKFVHIVQTLVSQFVLTFEAHLTMVSTLHGRVTYTWSLGFIRAARFLMYLTITVKNIVNVNFVFDHLLGL